MHASTASCLVGEDLATVGSWRRMPSCALPHGIGREKAARASPRSRSAAAHHRQQNEWLSSAEKNFLARTRQIRATAVEASMQSCGASFEARHVLVDTHLRLTAHDGPCVARAADVQRSAHRMRPNHLRRFWREILGAGLFHALSRDSRFAMTAHLIEIRAAVDHRRPCDALIVDARSRHLDRPSWRSPTTSGRYGAFAVHRSPGR